jgi:hypothetical protein
VTLKNWSPHDCVHCEQLRTTRCSAPAISGARIALINKINLPCIYTSCTASCTPMGVEPTSFRGSEKKAFASPPGKPSERGGYLSTRGFPPTMCDTILSTPSATAPDCVLSISEVLSRACLCELGSFQAPPLPQNRSRQRPQLNHMERFAEPRDVVIRSASHDRNLRFDPANGACANFYATWKPVRGFELIHHGPSRATCPGSCLASASAAVFHGRHLVDPGCVASRAETCSRSR